MAKEFLINEIVGDKAFGQIESLSAKLTALKKQMAATVEEMKQSGLDFGKVLGINPKTLEELQVKTDAYNNAVKRLNKAETELAELQKKYKDVLSQVNRTVAESVKEAKQKADLDVKIARAVQAQEKAEQAKLQTLIKEAQAEKALNSAVKSRNMTEEQRIALIREALALADKEVHSIDEANRANRKMREAVRLLKDTDEDYRETLGKLNATIGVNTDYVKRNSDRYTQQKMTVGDYKEQVKQAWMELNRLNDSMSSLGIASGSFGDSLSALGGIGDLMGNLKGIGGIMGNRWLLGLGAVGAAGAGIGWWVNYNKGLTEATRLTQQFTQKSGEDLKSYRTEVQAVADFYGKDFREVLVGANALSKQFGISAEESIRLVQDGFIAGADANGEFLDTLREYPAYFKEAGISAEAFIAITAQAAKSGIFSDKGVDVIKEGNIRIREMTDATAAALEGIGISADEVQEKLRKGQKTTFDIIRMVSERLDELPESSAEVGAAIADIFGGPGEDAGLQYIRTLKDIKTNLGDVKKETGELGKAQEDMIESQKRLSTELALLFDATGGSFENMVARIKSSLSDMAADLLATIRRSVESVEDISGREENQARSEGERYGAEDVRKQFEMIDKSYSEYVRQGISGENALKKARDERLDSMKRALEYEEKNLKEAVRINEKYYQEYQNASLWRQMIGKDRPNDDINADIQKSWSDRMSAERSVASLKKQIELVENYKGPSSSRKIIETETEEEKKARTDAEKSLQKSSIALMEEGLEKELATIRNGYEQRIKEITGNSSAEIELRKSLQQEMEKELADASVNYERNANSIDFNNRISYLKEGSQEYLDARLEQLELERAQELEAAEKTGASVLEINRKYDAMIESEKERMMSKRAEDMMAGVTSASLVDGHELNEQLRQLSDAYREGKKSKEDYEAENYRIQQEYAEKQLRLAIETTEAILKLNLSDDDRAKYMQQLAELEMQLDDMVTDNKIRNDEEQIAKEKEKREKQMELMQQVSQLMSSIGEFGDQLFDNRMEKLDEESESNQEAYDKEIERIDNLEESGAISTEEAEARKRAAEDKTKAKEEEIARRKAQLQTKQAIFDKTMSASQAIINTALAITRFLGNPVMIALVTAMGAAQLATIMATPIPKYRKGTNFHKGGPAIVGDGGVAETVVLPDGGVFLTPDHPVLMNLPKGAQVLPESFVTDAGMVKSDLLTLMEMRDADGMPVIYVDNDWSGLERRIGKLEKSMVAAFDRMAKESRRAQYEAFKKRF